MRLNGGARHRVFHKHLVVIALERVSSRRLHTHIGGDSAQNDGFDAASSQLGIELGAVKSTPLALGDQEVAGLGVELGDYGRKIRWAPGNAGRWSIGGGTEQIFAISQVAHAHQDDSAVVLAKCLDQFGGVGDDLSAGAGKDIHADNAVLEVDQDEGRCLWINVQTGCIHGKFL